MRLFALLACTLAGCSGGDDASSSPADAGDASNNDAAIVDASIDAASSSDSAPAPDAGCGEFAGDTRFTCSKDGNARGKCPGGVLAREDCARGCLREAPPADDVCLGTTDNFTCTGSYGTVPSTSGDYYVTSFGCWLDADGGAHTDPADNCIPSCFAKAKVAGLCDANDTGPQCEERVTWYTADAARFGCLARLRVTNPMTGKAVVAVALDYGPACMGENTVMHEVLDSSGRIDRYLFGSDQGASDRALVHVVQVDDATPLGPIP